jgi:hypothetical protein
MFITNKYIAINLKQTKKKMTLFNFLTENNDIIFYTLFTGVTSVIGWSWYCNSIQTNNFDITQIFRTMSPSVTETTVTPRTFVFTRNQSTLIQKPSWTSSSNFSSNIWKRSSSSQWINWCMSSS